MAWLYVIAVVVVCVVVVLLVGRWEGAAAPQEESPGALPDRIDHLLATAEDHQLSAADLQQVQFDSAFRGYRMDQVDKLLDALTQQLQHAPTDAPANSTRGAERDDNSAQ